MARTATLGVAKFQTDEGEFWRWLKGEMRKLQPEMATIDADKALATDPADDGKTREDCERG